LNSILSFSAEPGKNRLFILLKGKPSAANFPQALRQARLEVQRLQTPFDILSDVRELESFDELAARDLAAMLHELLTVNVRRRVTLVGKSTGGALHMERIARQIGHHAHLAFSFEEAEQVFSSR
jgi:hypothetical protein